MCNIGRIILIQHYSPLYGYVYVSVYKKYKFTKYTMLQNLSEKFAISQTSRPLGVSDIWESSVTRLPMVRCRNDSDAIEATRSGALLD